MGKETKLVQDIIAWVKETGGDAWHVHGNGIQRKGEPDLDGWWPHPAGGVIHFKIEVKLWPSKPSNLQAKRLERYAKAGYTTGVAYSLEGFQELLLSGARLYPRRPVQPLCEAFECE